MDFHSIAANVLGRRCAHEARGLSSESNEKDFPTCNCGIQDTNATEGYGASLLVKCRNRNPNERQKDCIKTAY